MIIIVEYLKAGETKYVNQFWFILSLLWAQFGLAAIFNSLMKKRVHRIYSLILITILPPVILFSIIHIIAVLV